MWLPKRFSTILHECLRSYLWMIERLRLTIAVFPPQLQIGLVQLNYMSRELMYAIHR